MNGSQGFTLSGVIIWMASGDWTKDD